MKSLTHLFYLTVLTFTLVIPSKADNLFFSDEEPISLFLHMQDQELLKVTLTLDMSEVVDNRKSNAYSPAIFTYVNEAGQEISWDIELRNRGRFRRRACDMPPLKLKFPKKTMKADGFNGHNDFKLVTHCLNEDVDGEMVLREYLSYQLYARLSPVHFRTQLILITYVDAKTGASNTNYGILIEDSDEMAERMQATVCDDCYNVELDRFDQSNLQVNALYQYMIGNTDFSVAMSRNLKILAPVDKTGYYQVSPYDFDFSGLVDAPYALPRNELGQRSVRQRVYAGDNWDDVEWSATIQHFQQKRRELFDTIDEFDLLSKKNRRDVKQYLKEFYELLDEGFIPENNHTYR